MKEFTDFKTVTLLETKEVGKWQEFWVKEKDSQRPNSSFDMCSKSGYFWEAVAKAGLRDKILSDGVKGLRLKWGLRGPNWEIIEFVDSMDKPIKDGIIKTYIPLMYNNKQVGVTDGDGNISFTDKQIFKKLIENQPIYISSCKAGTVDENGNVKVTKHIEDVIVKNKNNDL